LRHQHVVQSVTFSRDGRRLVSGGMDRTARLWDAVTGQPVGAPLRHSNYVLAAALSPDGRTVLTGCRDQAARLWGAADRPAGGGAAEGRAGGAARDHGGPVQGVAFSPDGRLALTRAADRTARLWEVDTGRPHGPPLQHDTPVTAMAFSPDGRKLATGGFDGTV